LPAPLLLLAACTDPGSQSAALYQAPAIPNEIDGVVFEAGNWEPHPAAGEAGVSWGNHRAVVVVADSILGGAGQTQVSEGSMPGARGTGRAAPDAVLVSIPWRRRDRNPEEKGIIVVDAATGEPVRNALATRVENVLGEVIFQPNPGSSTYHVYYMPWQSTGGYYPTITYPTPDELAQPDPERAAEGESPSRADQEREANQSWAGRVSVNDPAWERRIRAFPLTDLPRARTTRIQSVNDFHSFFPMELIAAPWEEDAFLAGAENGWRVVGEHRDRPVRMRRFLPQHWARLGGTIPGSGEASRMGSLRENVSAETPEEGPGPQDSPPASRRGPNRENVSAETPSPFTSQVLRDEAFTWQVAVVSGNGPLSDVSVTFHGFPAPWEASLTCFNCGGIDEKGARFTTQLDIPQGTVQPLWLGVLVPENQRPGTVEGTVTVSSSNRGSQSIPVVLDVQNARAVNHGFDEPELQSRLFWLNSTVGTDPDFIIEPFEPVQVDTASGPAIHALSVLGRRLELGPLGLPEQILSFFTPELTHFAEAPEPILARPIALEVFPAHQGAVPDPGTRAILSPEHFTSSPFTVRQEARGSANWTAEASSEHFAVRVEGRLEYDGMLDYRITLVARSGVGVEDIRLPVSLLPDAAEYMLGLGRKGGKRPPAVDWKWAVENHHEGVWLGGIHKGLQYVLRDENYVRPLNTNFYRNQPLNMPPSWFNEGRGGIRILEEESAGGSLPGGDAGAGGAGGDAGAGATSVAGTGTRPTAVTAYNYSGPRTLAAGDTLHFNVRFLITPFKPIDTRTHFNTRFVHMYVPVDSVAAWGGTVVNIHHANEINPYINYPFFALDKQKAYIDEAHAKGIKVKLYYTIRELTYKAWELFALRSLGDEILNDGEGGGHSWMQEHLEDRYHSAWHAWRVDDAAMLDKGTSRWTNYYVEGLSWLAEHQHIDGLYLDDIAFSRETVKRIVTVLSEERPEVVIDLHSANQFNVRDGFINSAMLYMEHFPFISRLWFGEYFEYALDEDYWMTEVSGLPFGLMGEMLQDGGHPYRGMLYGMTARMYGNVDPRPVWGMMNDFGVAESRMQGYWLKDAPVATDHPRILATTYVRPDRVLIALASWSGEDEVVRLDVDWEGLGFGAGSEPGESPGPGAEFGGVPPGTALRTFAPAVEGIQAESEVDLYAVSVPAGMGLFIVVTRDSATQR
jgi:hypothetical protein